MTELCPDCGRERAETADEGNGRCKAHLPDLPAPSLCKDLTIEALRRELAQAREMGELERAVVEAATDERVAREHVIETTDPARNTPSRAWRAAKSKHEAAYVALESAVDTPLAARKEKEDVNG